MNPYIEVMYKLFDKEETPLEDQCPRSNYGWLVSEYELIQQKKSKLSAVKRAAVVKEYERTHDVKKEREGKR